MTKRTINRRVVVPNRYDVAFVLVIVMAVLIGLMFWHIWTGHYWKAGVEAALIAAIRFFPYGLNRKR